MAGTGGSTSGLLAAATISCPIVAAITPIKRRRGRQPKETAADPLIPLVGFGMPDFDQITYQIRAIPVRPQPGPDAPRAGLNTELKPPCIRYGIDLTVSLQNFTFETTPDGIRHGRIEAMLVAYGRDGKIANIVKRNGKLVFKPEEFSQLPSAPFTSKSTFHLVTCICERECTT
jgi:hypothetical protein